LKRQGENAALIKGRTSAPNFIHICLQVNSFFDQPLSEVGMASVGSVSSLNEIFSSNQVALLAIAKYI